MVDTTAVFLPAEPNFLISETIVCQSENPKGVAVSRVEEEVRRQIEKAITLGKKNNLNSTRVLAARLADSDSALKVVNDIAVRFKDRNGGYTRIIKVGIRPGDSAEMALLEFVDYDWKTKEAGKGKTETAAKGKDTKKAGKAEVTTAKLESKKKKHLFIAKDRYKKNVRKMKNESRAEKY